jgi:hypothetical protein
MQITGDGSHNCKSPKGSADSAHKFGSWRRKIFRIWYQLTRAPKEDLLIGGMFATVIIITIWLAARLL